MAVSVFVMLLQIMQHFKSFIEDYNTATMPHEKYYNYERWEMMEYERRRREESDRRNSQSLEGVQEVSMRMQAAHAAVCLLLSFQFLPLVTCGS